MNPDMPAPAPPAAGQTQGTQEFLWKVHGYTNDYIKFADQKAGLFLAVLSGLVAALYSAGLHQACGLSRLTFEHATTHDTLMGMLALTAYLLLLAGIGSSLAAIVPRLWSDFVPSIRARFTSAILGAPPAPGAIFWKQVLSHGNKEAYLNYVQSLDEQGRLREVGHHIHAIAAVANKKFEWITLAVAFGAAGAVLAIVALFIK